MIEDLSDNAAEIAGKEERVQMLLKERLPYLLFEIRALERVMGSRNDIQRYFTSRIKRPDFGPFGKRLAMVATQAIIKAIADKLPKNWTPAELQEKIDLEKENIIEDIVSKLAYSKEKNELKIEGEIY